MEGVPPRPARARRSLVADGAVAAGRVRTGRAFRRQPGVKNSAFTGAAPSRHSGNRARPDRAGDGPPGRPVAARTSGRPVSADRRLLAVADALPVTVLAVIAGAGSFTHIRDTAAQHGQRGPMSWAVAVSMIERRPRPAAAVPGQDGDTSDLPAPGRPSPVQDEQDETLLATARRAAAEHQDQHSQPITRDALRACLGVSNQAASELLRHLRADEVHPPGALRAA
jgi:hypothetical protein